jgi:hypothetical protein
VENTNGFGVVTGELTGYARHTSQMAAELHELAARRIGPVRKLAEHGLGPIGRESGFAAALDHFAAALEHQVAGVAKNADALGDSVAKSAHSYRQQDDARAKELLDMITGRKS